MVNILQSIFNSPSFPFDGKLLGGKIMSSFWYQSKMLCFIICRNPAIMCILRLEQLQEIQLEWQQQYVCLFHPVFILILLAYC